MRYISKLIYLVLVTLLMFSAVSCSKENTDIPDENNNVKKQVTYAKDFVLKDIEFRDIKLSELKGKKVILNFWATWCPYCVEEMPDLNKLYQKYREDNFVLYAINVGEGKSKVVNFVEENNLTMPVLFDSTTQVSSAYGIRSFPVTIAIDEEGAIVEKKLGKLTYQQMEDLYKKLNE